MVHLIVIVFFATGGLSGAVVAGWIAELGAVAVGPPLETGGVSITGQAVVVLGAGIPNRATAAQAGRGASAIRITAIECSITVIVQPVIAGRFGGSWFQLRIDGAVQFDVVRIVPQIAADQTEQAGSR